MDPYSSLGWQKQSHIDAVVLQQTGLTLRQAQRFLSFPRKSIEKLTFLVGATQPSFNSSDSEFYPPQLLATTDYPGALFVAGELHALHSFQLAVVGVGRIHGMASDGTIILRNSGDAWSDNYEWTGAWNRWCGA
ncbi:hypothetical protein QQN82_26665 [Escherichia coli]|nr:hypothetical protein [Escherichia coli]MEA1096152.1 hypothetical protein [Escherichia coli]